MASTRQSRDHKKWLAARRAQFRLKQTFEYIDFVEDVLNPETEALLAGHVKVDIEKDSQVAASSVIKTPALAETNEARSSSE